MARPVKWRKVCSLPDANRFGPLDSSAKSEDYINMTVDEYEAIRLIDLEGFNQEECANKMNIARSTVQGIYIEARKKLAESLVNGKVLFIDGGEYRLCDGSGDGCGRGCRKNKHGRRNTEGRGIREGLHGRCNSEGRGNGETLRCKNKKNISI